MISFIVIYTDSMDFKYTINSIKNNNSEDYEVTIIASENCTVPNLDTPWSVITYKENESISIALNKSVNNINSEICFLVKSGCYITPTAIQSLKENILEDSIGIVLPRLNTFFEMQTYVFQDILDDFIVKESTNVYKENHKKKVFTKNIDDNLIVFRKTVFTKLGGFDKNFSSLPIIYQDYLFTNFQHGYNVIVALDALVYSENICDQATLFYSLEESLKEKLGFNISYYSGIRNDLINLMDENTNESLNILEVGCASGYTLMTIKNKFPYAKAYGLELLERCKKIAPPCVDIKIGDCMNLIDDFEDESLDYILCPDVLEHLLDPWKFIQKCHKKLSPSGKIIASIPNISHISVIEEILNGIFNYKECGILDSTHLRFFTINTMVTLFSDNGYKINHVGGSRSDNSRENDFIKELLELSLINKSWKQPLDLSTQFTIIQYHLVCSKDIKE